MPPTKARSFPINHRHKMPVSCPKPPGANPSSSAPFRVLLPWQGLAGGCGLGLIVGSLHGGAPLWEALRWGFFPLVLVTACPYEREDLGRGVNIHASLGIFH